MAKALKHLMVAEYSRAIQAAGGVIIVDPGPMPVERAEALRKDLRELAGGARIKVVHNRTVRRALEGTLYGGHAEALAPVLRGRSAIVFGGAGPISIARVLRDWKRKYKPLHLKGGVAHGEILDGAGVDGLADLPDLPQLRGMLLAALIGPARGLAVSLQAVYGGIARALQARIDKAGGEAAEEDGGSGGS